LESRLAPYRQSGLRYDYFGPTTETQGHFVGFDPSQAVTTPLSVHGMSGHLRRSGHWRVRSRPGNGNLPVPTGSTPGFTKVSDGLVNSNYKKLRPRIGFSISSPIPAKIVVCADGYGIFFDRPNMRLYNSQLFNMPYEMIATALAHFERKSLRGKSRCPAPSR